MQRRLGGVELPGESPGAASYLIIPGWRGSGPDHWQSHWEHELAGARRVEMADWDAPRRRDWVHTLDDAIQDALRRSETPPTLIAHSLGCIAVAHWAASEGGRRPIRGALLVAPADVDPPGGFAPRPTGIAGRVPTPQSTRIARRSLELRAVLRGFAPVPRARLPFPSRVVASDDDPYATLPRAQQMAADWGAALTLLPGAGHVNCDSGFGRWRDGLGLLATVSTARTG